MTVEPDDVGTPGWVARCVHAAMLPATGVSDSSVSRAKEILLSDAGRRSLTGKEIERHAKQFLSDIGISDPTAENRK